MPVKSDMVNLFNPLQKHHHSNLFWNIYNSQVIELSSFSLHLNQQWLRSPYNLQATTKRIVSYFICVIHDSLFLCFPYNRIIIYFPPQKNNLFPPLSSLWVLLSEKIDLKQNTFRSKIGGSFHLSNLFSLRLLW